MRIDGKSYHVPDTLMAAFRDEFYQGLEEERPNTGALATLKWAADKKFGDPIEKKRRADAARAEKLEAARFVHEKI